MAGLASKHFLITNWCQLIDQATITLNLMQVNQADPGKFAFKALNSPFQWYHQAQNVKQNRQQSRRCMLKKHFMLGWHYNTTGVVKSSFKTQVQSKSLIQSFSNITSQNYLQWIAW